MEVLFRSWKCSLIWNRYESGGAVSLRLVAAEEIDGDVTLGEPIATATFNAPEVALADNEILVKLWGGNLGILHWLYKANVIQPRWSQMTLDGGALVALCRLTVASMADRNDQLNAIDA